MAKVTIKATVSVEAEISEIVDLKQYFDEGGNLWLMNIQVVSLNKEGQLSTDDIHESIYLQDQDGFQFRYKHPRCKGQSLILLPPHQRGPHLQEVQARPLGLREEDMAYRHKRQG